MYPILWQGQGFILPAWHCFFMVAAIAAYYFLFYLRRRFYPEISAHHLSWVYIAAYGGGYVGARLLSIIIDQPEVVTLGAGLRELATLGPMTFYGGMLGAGFMVALSCYLGALPLGKAMDLTLPAGLLGLAIGRIGCFLNGDDYGLAVPLTPGQLPPWWAVHFPGEALGIWRVPVQLLESIGAAAIVAITLGLLPRLRERLGPMAAGLLALQLYCLLRFSDEFLRADPRGSVLGGALSPAQLISVLLLLLSFLLMGKKLRGLV